MAIPKLIHQTVNNKNNLQPIYIDNIKALKELNPAWRYTLYDDNDCISFIRHHYDDETLERYKKINPDYGAAKADYFRYLLVLKLGGIYLDIKSTCYKKLDDVILEDDAYILSHWNNKRGERYAGYGIHPELSPKGEYQQWHIIAAPDHAFLKAVVRSVSKNIDDYTPYTHGIGHFGALRTTGPIAYTLAIQKIQQTAKHRVVDIETLGFDFSILSTDKNTGVHITAAHYSYQRSPLILREFYDPFGNPIDLKSLSRNSPCPCGSGAKFKHCHGIL